MVINYKEAIPGNSPQPYKVTKTYQSDWHNVSEESLQIEGSSMNALYDNFVRKVAGSQISEMGGTLKEDIEISLEQQTLKKEIEALKKRIALERQPQKKFMLHKQLKELENKLK